MRQQSREGWNVRISGHRSTRRLSLLCNSRVGLLPAPPSLELPFGEYPLETRHWMLVSPFKWRNCLARAELGLDARPA